MTASYVVPSFGRRSLETLFPSIAGVLGVPGHQNTLGLPANERYVVLVIDGLGYELLERHRTEAPYLHSLLTSPPMTCGVPSTTATSLTSLGTGLTMGEHGVVGYTSRIPGSDKRLNALLWDQDVDPLKWQPNPTVLEVMSERGVAAAVINTSRFATSGLTRCSQRGVPFYGVDSVWERLDAVLQASETGQRSVAYAYEADLDHAGHVHGCGSVEWRNCLQRIDSDVRRLRDALAPQVALVITADHGMVDIPRAGRFDLDQHATLREDVQMVAGEARFRHLYTGAESAARVASRWTDLLGSRALVRTRDEATDEGWFGPVMPQMASRIGDVLVASLNDFAVFSSVDFAMEMKIIGVHGSLTSAEMYVPLLVDA